MRIALAHSTPEASATWCSPGPRGLSGTSAEPAAQEVVERRIHLADVEGVVALLGVQGRLPLLLGVVCRLEGFLRGHLPCLPVEERVRAGARVGGGHSLELLLPPVQLADLLLVLHLARASLQLLCGDWLLQTLRQTELEHAIGDVDRVPLILAVGIGGLVPRR